MKSFITVLCALIVGIGLSLSGYFVGNALIAWKKDNRYVTVKGLSERDVSADLALWDMRITATSNDLNQAQSKIDDDIQKLRQFALDSGLDESEIQQGATQVIDLFAREYRPNGAAQSRYIVQSGLMIETVKTQTVFNMTTQIGDLIKQGVTFMQNSNPTYSFTRLVDLKPEMLKEATENAREAAQQFADDSQARLGGIRNANQGIFSITAKNQIMGQSSDEARDKKVRVVSTVQYFLVD